MCELDRLRAENAKLRALLQANGIVIPETPGDAVPAEPHDAPATPPLSKRSPAADRVALFLSLFQGRLDVYAHRWESRNGRAGYSPACKNEWRRCVCLKPKGKCTECSHAEYLHYDENAVAAHLSGRCVLGVYPLLPDETCRFLAIDFDEDHWRDDVRMVYAACQAQGIPCSIEVSRSGKGACAGVHTPDAGDARTRATLLQIL